MMVVGLNSGMNDLLMISSGRGPHMHAIGAENIYFDVHVEADEHHSIMG